ncbi:glycosyltransferase family 2 protein [Nostoc sp. LEGE 06077]|uniref:glycosyltransferase family 2 protein n=1 Tax=Nostoc sp. LEGE 06077 TaxID=915325 RepID=UPI0018819F2C|nr:glycosyltransferase family A protein [Nostoc sp. LEGE 06077]MBE9205384.1 glycosyltransferase family 2 protein [Nostoc sp. LEGE 06077]
MSSVIFDVIPDISIILCTYNREKYLNRCINSVIAQIYQDWELIIVDDGSTDNTFEIVNQYIHIFPNIRYLKHQNKKLWHAKNTGIQASFGRYITFLDSDDAYLPEHLAARIKYMQEHPEIDLIEGGFATDEEVFVADYFQQGKTINLRECVLGPTFFGKRAVFFELKGFNNIAYGEDTDFWNRAEKAFKTQKTPHLQTYVYTRAETSITKSVLEEISQSS